MNESTTAAEQGIVLAISFLPCSAKISRICAKKLRIFKTVASGTLIWGYTGQESALIFWKIHRAARWWKSSFASSLDLLTWFSGIVTLLLYESFNLVDGKNSLAGGLRSVYFILISIWDRCPRCHHHWRKLFLGKKTGNILQGQWTIWPLPNSRIIQSSMYILPICHSWL